MTSLTRLINAQLLQIGILCCVCLLGILLFRIIRIFSSTLVGAIIAIQYPETSINSAKSLVQKFAHNSLLAHALNFLIVIINNCIHIFITGIRALFFVLYVMLPIVLISIALIIISEKWSDFLVFVANVYNEKIADVLKAIVIFPLDMIDLLGSNVLPVFNFLVYILIQIPIQIIFWLADGDGKQHFLECIKLIAGSFPKFAAEMKLFARQNSIDCKFLRNEGNFLFIDDDQQRVCSNATMRGITQCAYISPTQRAENCFDPRKRKANLMNVFENLQHASAHGILTIGTSCQFLNTIANITLYPLIDPLLWKSLDNLGNAVLHAFITTPIMTVQRCALAGGISRRPAMCTPDFGPAFEYLVNAALNWGDLLTHWFDVFYLFIFDSDRGELFYTCRKQPDYQYIFQDTTKKQMMGNNVTVLVRLTSQDFALTDGTSSIFVNERGSMRRSYVPFHWPINVDTSFGIARTFLPTGKTVSDNGIGMLGCTCKDEENKNIKMECSIVTKTGTSWVLPVDWSLSSEIQLLSCQRIRIVVQSLRWSEKRVLVEDLNQGSPTCTDDCLVGDVAIYVVPICGDSNGVKSLACLPERYFTRGTCFPYCMALHIRNEFQKPLIMRGAVEWEQGVFMANRDCIPSIQSTVSILNDNAESTCSIGSEQSTKFKSSGTTIGNTIDTNTCFYSVSCSSIVRNKTTLSSYSTNILDGYVPIITDSLSTDRGVRLTLDLQPLVIAGGVQMRRYHPTTYEIWTNSDLKTEYVVDFPTLVGNQYNEFTMEFHGSIGIPVASRARVPSEEFYVANSQKGKIFLPQAMDFVQKKVPFSPATLSSDALWYATNPSYDWMKAMISYCSSKGELAYTQVQFLSSYSPSRLWRVEYKRSSCYVSGPNMVKTCSENVSKSFSIDSINEIPLLNSTVDNSQNLYSMCISNRPLNLWVESLEDFDEYNIVIGVRRGSLADLGYLLDESGQFSKGESVFYFFSKFHEKIRESVPWTNAEYFEGNNAKSSIYISFLDMSCPKLRILPNVGSFIGHSLAASIYLFQVPINFIANPFAAQELIVSRGSLRCPENNLMHSALENCGMNMISLDKFFTNVYKSNEAFWDMISWVVFLITGGSSDANLSPEALVFGQFLQGSVLVGEASKIIAYMDVTQSVEFMDTGVENVLFKTGRRRILETTSFATKFSNMASVAKDGFFAILSAIKSFAVSTLTNLFSGADMSSLITTQNPLTSVISVSVTVPPIAWAQLTYDSVVPIVLDILSYAQNNKFSLKPLWVHMYDTMDRYDEIIHERHKRACMGYRLMFGYGSSTAKAIYYNCLAAAEMPRGLWTFILTILVDMNLYRCLCVYPAGKNYAGATLEQCDYLIPPNRKGLWQKLISSRNVESLCQEYSRTIETQLYGAFNSWILYSTQAAEASTNFFDELFIKRSQSMECNNIERNPTAVVLTPTPLYHYQVCSQTTSCRERCVDTMSAFEAELKRVQAFGSATHTVNYYNHEIENPIYNIYSNEWTNQDSLFVNSRKFVMSILTENVQEMSFPESICKLKCSMDMYAKCLRILVEKTEEREYEIQVFCLPGPKSILKSMYNIGVYSLLNVKVEVLKSNQDIMTHAEFSIQNISWCSSTFVLMYVNRKQVQVIDNKEMAMNSNEVFLWKSIGESNVFPKSILKNEDLSSFLNNNDMTKALYGSNIELFNIQILSLNIIVAQELFSGKSGMFIILFSFEVQIQANQRTIQNNILFDVSGNIKDSSESFLLYGIRRYCDSDQNVENHCLDQELEYFVPCDSCNSMSENKFCYESCNPEIDKLFVYLNHGNILHIRNHEYLYLPSKANFGDESTFLFEKFVVNAYLMSIDISKNPIIDIRNIFVMEKESSETMEIIGDWDRSKVFWTNSLLSKPVRDSKASTDSKYPTFFMSKPGMTRSNLNSEWLKQVRLEFNPNVGQYRMSLKNSIAFNGTSTLKIPCEVNSCMGCPSSKLKLLCAAAQDCTLVKCIGSVVQTKNLFCGLGNVFEKMATHSILTWRALYLSMSEMLLIIMRGLIGDFVKEVALKFPTDQFYTLVCALKDTYASYVGFGISVIEMISSNVFGSSGLSQGLSLIQNNDMVSALVGEQILKISSIGSLVFNLMVGSTLLPTLALHKWMMCITNSTMMQVSSSEFKLELDDTVMDNSWIGCAKIDGLASIVNSFSIDESLGDNIEMFVQFSKSLVTGIGDTILHGMILSWHAAMDFYIGLIWNIQDILYTFNLKSCKVPNYALRYVLWCACNDDAYRIPEGKRNQNLENGALWCVGTLNVNLQDGTSNAIIYNPYSLNELSEGVKDVVNYVNCLSEKNDPSLCDSYKSMYNQKLQLLVNQNVEPLFVWNKCKSNYLQSSWDNAAGALFLKQEDLHETDSKNPFLSSVPTGTRERMILWAKSISLEFLNCMQNPSRLRTDYSSCMRLFFDIQTKQTPNSYFIYEKGVSNEPPDACSVFSGISMQNISEHPNIFKDCIDEEYALSDSEISKCKLNPSVWSTSQNSKASVAKLHGNNPPWFYSSEISKYKIASDMYSSSIKKLETAWNVFETSFEKEKHFIDVQIFSADGDFIHEFFDCMYLGPYTRVDMFPCVGELECPFYARDEDGGKSREFTKCFGEDVMFNDTQSPYTCGSRSRRSIIKYYFRKIWSSKNLNINMSNKVFEKAQRIFQNYTNSNSLSCYDKNLKQCRIEACTFENGFLPCMDTDYNIDEEEMSQFIIEVFLKNMEEYYRHTLQNTEPWTLYAGTSGPKTKEGKDTYPFEWGEQKQQVLDEGFLKPDEPIIAYDTKDAFTIPTNISDKDKRLSSLWSLCMALLSQPSFSVPIINHTWKNQSLELPSGLWEYLLKNSFYSESYFSNLKDTLNTNDLTEVESIVRSIVRQHIKSHNPFVWHVNKRHAPSESLFCMSDTENIVEGEPSKMTLTNVELHYQDEIDGRTVEEVITFESEQSNDFFLNYGYLAKSIGTSHFECVCAHRLHSDHNLCKLETESCSEISANSTIFNSTFECQILLNACRNESETYAYSRRNEVFKCLNEVASLKCPEFMLSDTWGFYPLDCSEDECNNAGNWIGRGNFIPEYNRMRLVNEGRGGLRLTNYKHHNQTYQREMNYLNKKGRASDYSIPKCYDILNDLRLSEEKESLKDLIDNEIKTLFPASQMLYESHVTAFCSRFIIEIARIEILELIDPTIVEEYIVQAMSWKKKCHNKIRHFSACNMMGVYFEMSPPSDWKTLTSDLSGLNILNTESRPKMFTTPWGIVINQDTRKIFDGHVCAKNKNAYPSSTSSPEMIPFIDFSSDNLDMLDCEVYPSPFSFLRETSEETFPLSMLYDKEVLLKELNWIEELMPGISLETLYDFAVKKKHEHVSHVLDWWPEDILNFPIGFHTTASGDPEELAPVSFDSHFLYNSDSNTLSYVHTSLRNGSLLHENLGSCGICRSSTIGMPMFEANTNRICTRLSKHAREDVPTFPVYQMKNGGGNNDFTQWPYSDEFIERHFEPEYCTESTVEIPWTPNKDDALSQSAGNIPGWIYTASMNREGQTWYNTESARVYPPTEGFSLHEINEEKIFGFENDNEKRSWEMCKGVIDWKPTHFCDTQDASLPCPDFRSSCLNIESNSSRGICFPNNAYADSIISGSAPRYPCFATFHCPENQVCLADGGCSPLYLHFWNNEKTEMEITVLADECGFRQKNHPYTQSTRGASAWGDVPDILDVHGFCSKHNWFSFRHSMNIELCPSTRLGNLEYMNCDSNKTKWPWIIEKFDGSVSSSGNSKSLKEDETLSIRPHACDQNYMHLNNPYKNKRFEICSGHQGEQRSVQRDAYLSYALNKDSWDDQNIFENNTNIFNTKWWMRTYVESSDEISIAKFQYDKGAQSGALGFLGADVRLNNAFHELTFDNDKKSKFEFTKCMDRIKCQLPPFTYNGISYDRIDSSNIERSIQNHSERSLRLCGSIGYIENSVCVLDIVLFPMFSFFLSVQDDTSCSNLLWNAKSFKEEFKVSTYDSLDSLSNLVERNEVLHCITTKCIYTPRSTDKLGGINENDHIMKITQNLNNVIGKSIILIGENNIFSFTKRYEMINLCIESIYKHNEIRQMDLQRLYESSEPSGIYLGLKLTLIEIPLDWLLHAWNIALLSSINPNLVSIPNLDFMLESKSIEMEMWSQSPRSVSLCASEEKSFLLYLLCEDKYVAHTIDESENFEIQDYIDKLKQKITNDVINKLTIQKQDLNVKCFKKAIRNCDTFQDFQKYEKCKNALHFVHNTTVRKDTNPEGINTCQKTLLSDGNTLEELTKIGVDINFLDPCTNYASFELIDEVELPSEYLRKFLAYGTSLNTIIETLTTIMKETLSTNINEIITRTDYIAEKYNSNIRQVSDSTVLVDILHVNPFDEYVQARKNMNLDMDLTNYLSKTVCQSKYNYEDPDMTCKYQPEINENQPCLYQDSDIYYEYVKFADEDPNIVSENRNVITIKYSDQSVQTIDICNALNTYGRPEVCFVQYLGNMSLIDGMQVVPCDIKEIYAPPGVEIQAYAYTDTDKGVWEDILRDSIQGIHWSGSMCNANTRNVRQCTLRYDALTGQSTPVNAWWFGSYVTTGEENQKTWKESYMDRSTKLEMGFEDNLRNWWKLDSNNWGEKGCYDKGVCAIKVKLENVAGQSITQCVQSVPICKNSVNKENLRPYLVSKSANMQFGSLVRCAPCTRKESNVMSSDGLFGCQLRDSQNKPISNVAESITVQSIREKLPYMYDENIMTETFKEYGNILKFTKAEKSIVSSVEIRKNHPIREKYRKKWGIKSSEQICTGICGMKSIDIASHREADTSLWNEIVSKPNVRNIMVCTEQKLRIVDLKKCNPHVDVLRKQLASFTKEVYKKRNGVWMPSVLPGQGLAWQASVANNDVSMFSLLYHSSERDIRQMKTDYLLSEDICRSDQTVLNDRICLESKYHSTWPIEILNPWLGGNFNPFHGDRGLDECYTDDVNPQNRRKIMCSCDCFPEEFCRDPRNIYNYSEEFKNLEFKQETECMQRSFPQYHIMSENDDTNLCSKTRKQTSDSTCIHKQGIFGGNNLFTSYSQVGYDTFHSRMGSFSQKSDFLIQSMLSDQNGLWRGRPLFEENLNNKLFAFLSMPRADIHPAHIVFSFDHGKTGSPLLVKKIALLKYENTKMPISLLKPNEWLSLLSSEYERDYTSASNIYPNFVESPSSKGHWSCPYRKVTFWTNTHDSFFSPKIPNPLVSKILYTKFKGMHPLVRLSDVGEKLKDYKTSNGLCFYEDVANGNAMVPLSDGTNPCGLKQIFKQYMNQKYALSRVMSHFHDQCMDIIDFPGGNATLRSGEEINESQNKNKCGVLHRLTPFLMRTVGNNSYIQRNRKGLYTHSEGGDCHMGRVFKHSDPTDFIGKQCHLKSKTKHDGIIHCEGIAFQRNAKHEFKLERVQPLNAKQISMKKYRCFEEDIISGKKPLLPKYVLAGSFQSSHSEVSQGLLYKVSIPQMLSEEIMHFCKSRECIFEGPWRGGKEFLKRFQEKSLFRMRNTSKVPTNVIRLKEILYQGLIFTGADDSLSKYLNARLKNEEIWKRTNWTWSYYTRDENKTVIRKFTGSMNESSWRRNRFKTCNQSYYDWIVSNNHDVKMDFTTMRVKLCEPAPTGGLQEFCKALLMYRNEIQQINCQIMGNNDCLYKPSMFYLPYEWSTTNQRFATETVRNYYEQVFETYMPLAKFGDYCKANSILDDNLIRMSKLTEKICPGNKIEYLKDSLESIKYLGSRVLYIAYCLLMFVVNILAMVFAKSKEAANEMFNTAMTYFDFFIGEMAQIAMPILNAFLELIFGISEVGKVFKFIIIFICERYNTLLDIVVYGIWCPKILPLINTVFTILKGIVFMDSNAVSKLDDAWNVVSRGMGSTYDYKKCFALFGDRIRCNFKPDRPNFNDTTFSTQPFATRCWVSSQEKNGYSHVFSGSTEFSYLACAVGDTCAIDSTMFDNYEGGRVIPCASCPNIAFDNGQSFGCNTYLKRCTCATRSQSISSCLTNNDCQQSKSVCSMATSIDRVRSSAASMECSTCGQLNQEPICIMDGAEEMGVCTCASVQQSSFLQTCSDEFLGGISLVDPTKQCFVSNNRNFINVEDVTIQMDFADLAVGPCALGKVQRGNILCMRVVLPLASRKSTLTKTFVVLVNFQTQPENFLSVLNPATYQRRLLSVNEIKNVEESALSKITLCSEYLRKMTRESMKECIEMMELSRFLQHFHNISILNDDPFIFLAYKNLWFLHHELWKQVSANELTLRITFQKMNPQLSYDVLDSLSQIKEYIMKKQWNREDKPFHKNIVVSNDTKNNNKMNRRLLQFTSEVETRNELLRCSSLEYVASEISNAFWITIQYYDRRLLNTSSKPAIFFYNYPDFANDSLIDMNTDTVYKLIAYKAISFLFSGGAVEGKRILQSFVANVSEEEAIEKNYFTGKRFLGDIAKCNYSRVTFGPDPPRSVLPWFTILFFIIFMISSCCSSSNLVSLLLWVIIFPIIFLWSTYNISPLCFPMIPPNLPHDLITEIKPMIPSRINIPYFLVKTPCLTYKRVTNKTMSKMIPDSSKVLTTLKTLNKGDDCFKKCTDYPFLMKSWQDPMAWWLCEVSTTACRKLASFTEKVTLLKDFTSSSYYFAKVLDAGGLDEDFMKAHRFCALFTTHEIMISGILCITLLLVVPSVVQSAFDIFFNSIVLVIHANNAENID